MRLYLLVGLLLVVLVAKGQVEIKDLPKPVSKFVADTFGSQEMLLIEKKVTTNVYPSDKFYAVVKKGNTKPEGYLHTGRVNTCRSSGCSAPATNDLSEKSEYFEYAILFSPEPAVKNIRIYNYQASYGQEITARGWLRQFMGFSGNKSLEAGKDIDTISGATVSVVAITGDVQYKTRLLKELLE